MTFQELRDAVNASNMKDEAKIEIDGILAQREWEEEQAQKGEKF